MDVRSRRQSGEAERLYHKLCKNQQKRLSEEHGTVVGDSKALDLSVLTVSRVLRGYMLLS